MPTTPSVFITAAGSSTRFNGQTKQLLPVDGEPIIRRTIRLVREYDPDIPIYVVTWKPDLKFDDVLVVDTVKPTNTVTDTILFTEPWWSQTNVFLLGDVVYYPQSLRKILNSRCLKMFGSTACNGKGYSERFALTFQACDRDVMMKKCVECESLLDMKMGGLARLSITFKHPAVQKLVYLHVPGLQPVKSFIGNKVFKNLWWKTSMFEEIGDQTYDIDTPEEYEECCCAN